MKRFLLSTLASLFFVSVLAQIPAGYYNTAQGLTGTPLRQALHNIIDNHTSRSYAQLWTDFQVTDKKTNGKVWDIYSDNPGGTPPYEFTFVSDQCGNYSGEADCYNREHSWPKSWFNDLTPMYSDLFHLYPTDGYVNNIRGNYAYGEVSNPNYTSQNGSKRGPNTFPGFSGTVFEPIDEYKGDLARTYFYMCTRYYGEDSGWSSSDMTTKAELKAWALDLLKKWNEQDPVSQKEIDRNNKIYTIQNNRNPFIDHPEYACLIWPGGTYCTTGTTVTVATSLVSPMAICAGAPVLVSYTTTGTVNPGNVYTVQLSDATGSFTNAVTIGTTTAANPINCTIPANTFPGTSYKIRVNASSPATTGTANANNITISAYPVASVNSSNTEPICPGEMVHLTASGGTSFLWDDGSTNSMLMVTPQTATSYIVVVSNATGCADTASIMVEVYLTPTPVVSWNGSQLSSSISTGNQWYWNGNALQEENGATYTPGSNGNYFTIVTTESNCITDTSNTITITNLGVAKADQLFLHIAPNPSNGMFNVKYTSHTTAASVIRIMNQLGQVVYEQSYASSHNDANIDMSNYPKGIYTVRITNDQFVSTKRVVIQ